jgi:hypothetical protein
MFEPAQNASHHGFGLLCGDGILRVFFLLILIASLDGKEACAFTGCRSWQANFPCPRCLVRQEDLARITSHFTPRTTQTMKEAYVKAQSAPNRTRKEAILAASGLHDVEVSPNFLNQVYNVNLICQNFAWNLRFSDPYKAYGYDPLHRDDLGKWGKHLWVHLKTVLKRLGRLGHLTTA